MSRDRSRDEILIPLRKTFEYMEWLESDDIGFIRQ